MCVCVCVCGWVRVLLLLLATSQHSNKSRNCCHKIATPSYLSAGCILRELRRHYREEKETFRMENQGRGRQRSKGGVLRPLAEGLI